MTVVSRAAALLILSALFVALAGGKPSMTQTAQATARYLKLADHLDRPVDGYCLDVPGAGGRFRLDKPLTVHNCKSGRAPDGVVVHRDDGTLWFPAFDLCVTAMGTNRGALPGSALMPKPCDETVAFADGPSLKRFAFLPDGRLSLAGSDLCLVAGARSSATFSASHRWRTLYLDICATAPTARSQWVLIEPLP